MSDRLECQYCGYKTNIKSHLKRHQENALYCMEIRNKEFKQTLDDNEEQNSCDKIKKKTIVDYKIEISALEATIKEKDRTIEHLQDQIDKLQMAREQVTLTAITRPTNVRNTIKNVQVNQLTPLLEGEMKSFLPNLTKEHVKDGPAGYARYALEYPLKDKFTVADSSRKKLAWKNETGEIVYDVEGTELSKKFFRTIKEKNLKLVRELMDEITDRKDSAVERNDQAECNACDFLMIKLSEYRRGVIEASKECGTDDTAVREAFVKYLCASSGKGSNGSNDKVVVSSES